MAAKDKLTPAQREEIMMRLGERLPYRKIAREFGVLPTTIGHYYRQNRDIINAKRAEHDARLLDIGFANLEQRLSRLNDLAERLDEELDRQGLYYAELKVAPNGETVEQQTFNRAMVAEFRALLDDIARELGHRQKRLDLTSGGKSFTEIARELST